MATKMIPLELQYLSDEQLSIALQALYLVFRECQSALNRREIISLVEAINSVESIIS